ncbi:MAG TPA: glycosyl hydrolase family 28-related protein [Candidatus Methylacidiphilales bacterium]|nr:glycosyl hydrolase family 28-related protein [Candidatus Methylacidiphilales bacterium]
MSTLILPQYGINVRDEDAYAFSLVSAARGDGASDDSAAIQHALDLAAGGSLNIRPASAWHEHLVVIPAGRYKIGTTLRISSNTRLLLHPQAHIILADGAGVNQDVFLITNKHHQTGDTNIQIEGGIWDGNNPGNPRGPDAPGSYTGVAINFRNVNGLHLSSLRVCEAESYNIRISEVRNFVIQDVRFEARSIRRNQDGIHLCGGCSDGLIQRIRTGGMKATNDDLIAFVADDAMQRAQNLGGTCGHIRRVRVNDVTSDDCHSFVRLGSVWSTISDVTISNVRGGFRCNAVNADALRYCAVPVFNRHDPQFASGVGLLENVSLSDFDVYCTEGKDAVLLLETRMKNFQIRNFRRDMVRDLATSTSPTVRMRGIISDNIVMEGLTEADTNDIRESWSTSSVSAPSIVSLASPYGDSVTAERFRLDVALREKDQLITHAHHLSRLSVSDCEMSDVPGEDLRDGKYRR